MTIEHPQASRELWLVAGHIAAGKSTYCKQVAEERGTTAFYLNRDTLNLQAMARVGRYDWWDWAQRTPEIVAQETIAMAELYDTPLATAITGDHPLVIVESDFTSPNEATQWKEKGLAANRQVKMKMFFTRGILEALASSYNREFSGADKESQRQEFIYQRYDLEHVPRDLLVHKNLVSAFDAYVKAGMEIELYENPYLEQESSTLKLVATAKDGKLCVEDEDAYPYFRIKEKVNAYATVQVSATPTGDGRADMRCSLGDDGSSLFDPPLSLPEQEIADTLQFPPHRWVVRSPGVHQLSSCGR